MPNDQSLLSLLLVLILANITDFFTNFITMSNNTRKIVEGLNAKVSIPLYPFLLSCIWFGISLIINPLGDFPLNDDWSYAYSVRQLVEKGEISFSNWPAMTLISQTLWGALFCSIFGFSFTVLRISTLFGAWIGIIWLYKLLKEMDVKPQIAFFYTLLWVFNPLYLNLSYSFMTDIHFSTFCIGTFYAVVMHIKYGNPKYWLLATLLCIGALLVRQFGLVLPLGLSLTYAISNFPNWKKAKYWVYTAFPIVSTVLVLAAYNYWRGKYFGFPPSYGQSGILLESIKSGAWESQFKERLGIFGVMMGIFLFPAIGVLLQTTLKEINYKVILLYIFISISIAFYVFYPYWDNLIIGNIFWNIGLGPELTRDIYHHLHHNEKVGSGLWAAIKILGILGGTFWICYIIGTFFFGQRSRWFALQLGAAFAWLAYGCLLALSNNCFDRYAIPMFAFATIILAPTLSKLSSLSISPKRIRLAYYVGGLLLFIYAWFGITATHDFLAFNRTRKQATDYLMQTLKKSPREIDGGFEFNGWHLYQASLTPGLGSKNKSWWWVEKDDYIIAASSNKIDGYTLLKPFSFNRWLPMKTDTVFILHPK